MSDQPTIIGPHLKVVQSMGANHNDTYEKDAHDLVIFPTLFKATLYYLKLDERPRPSRREKVF